VLCPACHRDSSSATTCLYCGASLLNTGAPAPTGGSLAPPESNSTIKSLFIIGGTVVSWLVNVYLAYLRTIRGSKGVSHAETSGFFIGSLLTPFLIAAFIVWIINRARTDKLSFTHKQLLTAVLALGISVISFAGSLRIPPPSDESAEKKKMGHLMKQAAGKEAATPDAEWYDGPTREFFHDILAFNQEYTGAIQALGPASMNKLYTPESYATRAGMENTITHLHALLDVDKKYESLDPVVKKLEASINATSASQYEKDEFLKGFRGNFSKSLAPRNETFRSEEAWLQSSIDLYEFTLAHSGNFRIQNKKLIFHGDGVLDQFQALQSKAISLRKATIDSKNKLAAARKDAMYQTGVSPGDISAPGAKEK
jgi:hypothetical protein